MAEYGHSYIFVGFFCNYVVTISSHMPLFISQQKPNFWLVSINDWKARLLFYNVPADLNVARIYNDFKTSSQSFFFYYYFFKAYSLQWTETWLAFHEAMSVFFKI